MSSAPSFLRTFFKGLARSPRSFVFMFRGYFDAGKGGKPNVVSFAGYMATIEQWDRFSDMWKRLLDEYDLDNFHMTDYESRKAHPYRDWDDKKHLSFIKRAIDTINEHVVVGISYSIYLPSYEKIMSGEGEAFEDPLPFCMVGCVREVEHWARFQKEPISYVLDQQQEGRGRIMDCMDTIQKSLHTPRFEGTWTFGDRRLILPLQAADIIAYESWKHWYNTRAAETKRDTRKSLRRLNGKPHRGKYLSGLGLLEFRTKLRAMSEERQGFKTGVRAYKKSKS